MNDIRETACPLPESPVQSRPAYAQSLVSVLSFVPRIFALLVLIIYAPVVVAAGLLVMLTSPGPAFVKKAYRRSKGSQDVVYLYELRTECWRTWQPTSLGRWLLHLDIPRIPRLVNVLQGEINAGERVHRINA